MPGMPIFQDSPSQLKSQIYVWDSDAEEIAALTVDAGHLPVTGSVGLTAGTEVGLASGAEVALVSATTVGLAAGSNLIGKVENQPVFTNVDAFGAGAILTPYSVGSAATVEADAQDISLENSYNWFIKNTGDTPVIQTITLVVEISPDHFNWLQDTSTIITVNPGESKMITVTHFLKYARYTITGGSAATTVISCFQAQH